MGKNTLAMVAATIGTSYLKSLYQCQTLRFKPTCIFNMPNTATVVSRVREALSHREGGMCSKTIEAKGRVWSDIIKKTLSNIDGADGG